MVEPSRASVVRSRQSLRKVTRSVPPVPAILSCLRTASTRLAESAREDSAVAAFRRAYSRSSSCSLATRFASHSGQ